MKKKLEELNLLDDFLFGTIISHPIYGEKFAKILIKIILKRDLEILKIVSQMNYYGQDTDYHGARIDVYLEEDETAVKGRIGVADIYDIEPDQSSSTEDRKALPRRVRFYRSIIDARNLQSGKDYGMLKNVIIIMIMPYDPFGYDRMIYTVKNRCLEEPEIEYDDGALNLYLYTKGSHGDCPKELKELLHYFENTVWDNAVNESLQEIQTMVDKVKHDREVSISYMKMYERDRMIRKEGHEEGHIEGLNEGRQKGLNEGLLMSIKGLLSEYGILPESIEMKLDREKNVDILSRWVSLAAKSSSIEEFVEKM